jgi:ankyrin repeat protein
MEASCETYLILLTLDILREILVLITEKDAWSLRFVNKKILRAISKIRRKNNYWKYRCQVVLNINMSSIDINNQKWKYLYKLIKRTDFNRAFYVCCFRGLTELVKMFLLDSRVNPFINNNKALGIAYKQGHHEIIEMLLLHPKIQFSPPDELLYNVCDYIITCYENYEFVKKLLQDSRFEFLYKDDFLAMHCNIKLDIYQFLLKHPKVDPSARKNAAIICASSSIFTTDGVVESLLLDPRVNPADRDNYAVIVCARNGTTRNLKLLLADPRVNPTAQNNSAFITACGSRFYDNVKLLYDDPRVDPSADGNAAIICASKSGNFNVVKMLLGDIRVNPADRNNLTIIEASRYGHVDIVNILLNDNRVNPADQNNRSFREMCVMTNVYRPGIDKISKMLLDHSLIELTLQNFKDFLITNHMARDKLRSVLLSHPKYLPYKTELLHLIR